MLAQGTVVEGEVWLQRRWQLLGLSDDAIMEDRVAGLDDIKHLQRLVLILLQNLQEEIGQLVSNE